jgi:hypothetical protein
MALEPIPCLDRLIVDVPRSHTIRHIHTHTHTTSDRLVADAAQHTTNPREKHPYHQRVGTHDPQNRAAAGVPLGPHDHLERI